VQHLVYSVVDVQHDCVLQRWQLLCRHADLPLINLRPFTGDFATLKVLFSHMLTVAFGRPLIKTIDKMWRQAAVLVFQCLTGQAPAYLAGDCQLTSDVHTCRLQSTDTKMCVIRRSNNTFGDRCFASTGPCLWNRLPPHLCQCDGLEQFKRLLKTHLFGPWDRGALRHFC